MLKIKAVLGIILLAAMLFAPALGQTNDVGSLIQALKDDDYSVKEFAAVALGEIKDPRAINPLIETFKDNDSDVQASATEALKSLGWKGGS